MRRVLVITFTLAGFLVAGQTSLAVEKVDKKKTSTTQPKPAEPRRSTPPARPVTPPKKTEPSKKKYDDFIDKNKNGVDDRKETPGKKRAG